MQKSEADWNPRQAYSEHPGCHFVRPIQSIRPVISSGLLSAFGLSYRHAYTEHPPSSVFSDLSQQYIQQ